MKLKKRVKQRLTVVILVLVCILAFFTYKHIFNNKNNIQEVKVVCEIKEYGYTLKDNKSKEYKKMFQKLRKILSEKKVNEKDYVEQISKMYIYDFYSLSDKSAKTDVGGVDFIYSPIVGNFIENATSTYYKYVESNIYNQRKQKLPEVKNIKISSVEQEGYAYGEENDSSAYKVDINWDIYK